VREGLKEFARSLLDLIPEEELEYIGTLPLN
jgi:hypothetical protein